MLSAQDSPNLTRPVGFRLTGISGSVRAAGNKQLPTAAFDAYIRYPLRTGLSPTRGMSRRGLTERFHRRNPQASALLATNAPFGLYPPELA
jgi:hypothetical protein